jgi:outer membrane protein assembly factor BamB
MGEVYLAESGTGLRLAVKVVRAEHAEDRTFRARFRQEVRAAQTVGGAGTYTARVVDADTEAERPWMATEFVDGPNLRDAVLDHGALPEEAVRVLAAALCEALAAIHAQGMVHRDLKPSNILLAADGPRVIDFGIVRALEATALTRTGTVVGSVGYVSPEQIRTGGRVRPPSDVFSLGAVLAYAAGGREPFGEGRDAVVLMRIMNRDFDLSGVPEDIRWLVEPCLREEPEERPTPGEMISAVGHTARSLHESLRPGWFTASAPVEAVTDPAEAGQRWLPERGSGERESRVEYVAPVTVTDVAVPQEADQVTVTDVPAGAPVVPSRRRLLRGLVAGGLGAAGAGTGGWLWLRDGDAVGGGERGGADAGAPASARRAVVDWDYGTGGLAGKHGACVALSPDGDSVYVGGEDGALHALSSDGVVLWNTDLSGSVTSPLATADGAYCLVGGIELCAVGPKGRVRWRRLVDEGNGTFPVAAGDLVLVTTGTFADKGTVRAYRPDGRVAWNVRTPATPTGVPLAADGVVYVGTSAGLVALDAKDGALLWTALAGFSSGRPALVGGTLVVGSDDDHVLHGVSATGEERWYTVSGIGSVGRSMGSKMTFATFGDLAVTTSEGPLVAVDPADGSVAWTFQGDGDTQTYVDPSVHRDLVYVRLGRTLYVVDRNGKQTRAVSLAGLEVGTTHRPVVRAQRAYGERVYIGTTDGIAALDMTT